MIPDVDVEPPKLYLILILVEGDCRTVYPYKVNRFYNKVLFLNIKNTSILILRIQVRGKMPAMSKH